MAAVDNKDSYTHRHSDEVTEYALAIAAALGLSDETQRIVRVAGLLHDVGKIGVPGSILRKPGRLTSDDYEIMKQHTLLGELIIQEVPNLKEIRAAVVSHHERWDGSGYPRGLAGEAIPLLGRIMSVADAYSAMISDRPYRSGLTTDVAVAELRAGAGTQFDPTLVELFVEAVSRQHASRSHRVTEPRRPPLDRATPCRTRHPGRGDRTVMRTTRRDERTLPARARGTLALLTAR